MADLFQALGELIASILHTIGLVGQTRRRASIKSDLELFASLRDFEEFGAGSKAHEALARHIELEIEAYTASRKVWKKRDRGTIVLSALFGAGFGYLTEALNSGGFVWYSLAPGIVAGLMALVFLSEVFNPTSGRKVEDSGSTQPADASAA
ncbi:MAG TPA: hypothetical protein VGF95_08060 [Solirubrobacteraceae bacterium]|jgi:hypothetical protein